jgi:hypothetical protein
MKWLKMRRSSDRELFGLGAVVGITCLSIALASVPRKEATNLDDVAVSQGPTEMSIAKEQKPNYDGDVQRLSQLESRYREELPLGPATRIKGPLERVSKKKYHPTRVKTAIN